MLNRRTSLIYTSALAGLSLAGQAQAQSKYPDQTVKLIVALPAGGGVDMIARTLGQKLTSILGQSFVVENRAGGSGQIGMPAVAKAPADGYTLTVSPASFLTTNKSIFKSLAYDPETDFAPVTRLVNQACQMLRASVPRGGICYFARIGFCCGHKSGHRWVFLFVFNDQDHGLID